MHLTNFRLGLLLLPLASACGVERLEAIIEMYDTFGTTMTTGDTTGTSTSDTSTSTTSAESTGRPLDTSTGGMEESGGAESSSGGPPAAWCGDGVMNLDDEECDDGNEDPDDGCKLCARDRMMFVTSEWYQGFSLQGLYGADQRCRMRAALAGLPNVGTYKAWLSDSRTSAAARLHHSRGRYVRVDGAVVAEDWEGLVSGGLVNPINLTEYGIVDTPPPVWTGTLPNGDAAPNTEFCGDWLDAQATDDVPIGVAEFVDDGWTYFDVNPCGSDAPLYCVEN
jgi:cysteine-rich repeat protein